MRIARFLTAAAIGTMLIAEPAFAATPVPEPSDFGLFLLGVAGLIIGRRSASARRHKKDDSAA